MPKKLTNNDLAGTEIENTMHLNLGGGSYGYGYRSKKFPRIGHIDYVYRGALAKKKGVRSERVWTLDGERMESMDAALEGHAIPPTIDDEERKVLDLVRDDWRPYREVAEEIDKALGHPERETGRAAVCYAQLSKLKDKGLVETKREACEPTEFTRGLKLDHLDFVTMIRKAPADGTP